MAWLSEWLKTVIMVILLAVFVDLLLPSQKMQRYVRTVVSLLILLVLLTPVFSLFDQNAQIDKLLNDGLFRQNAAKEEAAAIQQNAEALQAYREEQALQLVQSQAAELMKRQLEQSLDIRVSSIQVHAARDAGGQSVLQAVEIRAGPRGLADDDAGKQPQETGKIREIEPIKPVEPVSIEIASHGRRSEAVAAGAFGKKQERSPQEEQRVTQIVYALQKEWQLGPEQISVEWHDPEAQ